MSGCWHGHWLGGVLGGTLLALAALVKISSLTVALAALVLLWALDRRRGWIAAVAALVTGLLAVGLIWWLAPWEIDWLLDIRALQPDPWTRVAADEAGHYLLNLAARWPTVALLPAFFVGATRAEVWPTLVAMALTGLAIAYQGQYFIYHSAALVVLSAVLAVRTIQRSGGALRWPLLVLCGWTLVLFILPAAWRVQHPTRLYLATLGWTIGLAVWQWRALRRPPALPSGRSDWWAAALVTAAMLATQTPISAESANLGTAGRTSWASATALQRELAEADVIRDVIGADSQVVYLSLRRHHLPDRQSHPLPVPVAAVSAASARRREGVLGHPPGEPRLPRGPCGALADLGSRLAASQGCPRRSVGHHRPDLGLRARPADRRLHHLSSPALTRPGPVGAIQERWLRGGGPLIEQL